MDSHSSILDDNQTRDLITKEIENAQQRPFSTELEDWLIDRWNSPSRKRVGVFGLRDKVFSAMVREENVELVQKLTGNRRHLDVFHLYWDSGLFSEARTQIEELRRRNPTVITFSDLKGHSISPINPTMDYFETSECFAQWSILGTNSLMLKFMNGGELFGHSFQTDANRYKHNPIFRALIIIGSSSIEKLNFAQAIHFLSEGKGFEVVACKKPNNDPLRQIEACQYGGTVFFNGFEALSQQWRPSLLQTINNRRYIKKISTSSGELEEPYDLNTLFILGIDDGSQEVSTVDLGNIEGKWLLDQSVIGTTGLTMRLPSLLERRSDIPLLVNQHLLTIGQTRLDSCRHALARILMESVDKQPNRDVEWLKTEVERCVQEFSPETPLPAPNTKGTEGEDILEQNDLDSGSHTVLRDTTTEANVFRKEGDGWIIVFEGTTVTLIKDLKGFNFISFLLEHPDQNFTLLQLMDAVSGKNADSDQEVIESPLQATDEETIKKLKERLEDIEAELKLNNSDCSAHRTG